MDQSTIDNFYDRQIRTYGKKAVQQISNSSVLIYGLNKGLGTEVAKNLTLSGIRTILLYDQGKVTNIDLETGFYFNTDSFDKTRSHALVSKLQELNPYVTIQAVEDFKQGQNVTIVINQSIELVSQINKYSRETNSKMVALYSCGISGTIFVDAGDTHLVSDTTGETIEPVQIGEITLDGKVKCAPNSAHDFQSGDYIRFDNLEGINIEQFNKEWKINVINKTTFQLKVDSSLESFTFINGTAIHIKKPVQVSHQTWKNQLENPSLNFSFDIDGAKKLVQTYIQMFTNNLVDSMPFIWSESNKDFMETNKIYLPEYARTFGFELMPIVSLMGSIAASEAIKLVTNKYMPINQWFTWSDSSLIPCKKDLCLVKTAYGFLWGSEFENKLFNSKWFIVGSGAIGCEHLKNLAYMNVANTEFGNGELILTDPDFIEKSNLNRQFLFRSHDIGKPKSETAVKAIKDMKPQINIKSLLQKVGSDSKSMEFTEQIMNSDITGVLNALDNIQARRFMDEMCFKYGLPLFESGTTGTKGNTQPVIPFVTETYSNSTDPEQEKTFPICTIKSFPNEISHTIHWAMDQFEFFNRAPITLNKWIENPNSIEELSQIEKSIAIGDINEFTIKHPTQKMGLKGCVEWAIDMFTENYYNSIIQLLHTFTPEHEVAPGVKFWSAGKRCPKPIKFDSGNKDHFNYIKATTHILARISGINDNFTDNELLQMIQSYQPAIFVPKEIKIATNDSEIIEKETIAYDKNISIGSPSDFSNSFVPQEFEKDDDSNWHINWVTSSSNIRAMNYGIPIADYQQTKGIAGRIIPAISTTTSAVSGLILIEMLKYLLGFNKVDQYRSTFINLAEPILVYSDPIEAPMIEISGVKLNSWTKFEYTKDSTVGEFKEFYDKQFKTNINMIVIGTSIVYAEFIGSESLEKKLSDSIKEALDIQYIPSNVSVSFATEDECELPSITITL